MPGGSTDRPFFLEWTTLAHRIVEAVLRPGEVAVDATVGNGHDTLFLAQRVGPEGHVYGFDVQAEALARTRARLEAAAVHERVTLFLAGHEHMAEKIPRAWHGRLGAVMFNLGYLPGGTNRTCITRPETTLPALEAALYLLRPGGVLTLVAYRGHPGGAAEAEAVQQWATRLPPDRYVAARYTFCNRQRPTPELIVVHKMVSA
ncbi:class I SAM-dependent methyltransferase [Rhodothermus profundi]|uniref:Putative rRNA methylase n=1 Tax=Rhodothermus profundi TaxID=633813 RepID=A0A1M6P8H3_9BACT|nr:class I SAM-dependent methyltransferase [Rhodothermus profundi]SHK04258.1 Putative rRNA methylase [Rhodothermus profundi]